MILFEVFKKRGTFLAIFKQCWNAVVDDMSYPKGVEQDALQKLAYFGMIAYALVYESALAAGMSASAAHYLARMQLGKYKLGRDLTSKVEAIFSGSEDEEERACAELFLAHISRVVADITSGREDVSSILDELSQSFRLPARLS